MKKQIEEMAATLCHSRNIVKSLLDRKCSNCFHEKCDILEICKDLYNAGYRKQSEGEWISVEERLPTPFVSVLVYMPDETPHPTVREGFINKRGEWYAGGFDRLPDEVVSWREMPEPPKMKGGAE